MAQAYLRRHSKIYSPADKTQGETVNMFNVYKGDRIVFGDMAKRVLSSTANTIAVALHGGNAGGIMAAKDTSAGSVGDLVNAGGSDLANGGLLVTADGNIDIVYAPVGGGGTTAPVVRITIYVVEKEQKS